MQLTRTWFAACLHASLTIYGAAIAALLIVALDSVPLRAQTVTASVNMNSTLAVMPEYAMGIHTSVYDNSLWHIDVPPDTPGTNDDDNFDLLPSRLHDAGITTLRYPGGGYADVFHFSLSRTSQEGGMNGHGLTPWWGQAGNYGYMGRHTDFGSFVRLLDATNSKTVITVNTGGAVKFDSPNALGVPTHGGQPQEAAAWVAYANGDAALYGTPQDKPLGVDAEGNNWRTVGYWAKLRASTPNEYSTWATADGNYDSRSAFLAIDRDAPVGITYWEIGNETFGTSYYGGQAGDTGYALNYAAPYDGTPRDDNPALSPAAYGAQVNAFGKAMNDVDPNIKVGAVLATPRTQASNPIGDYSWSYADLNDDGIKQANEPYWNDEVLSHTDAELGKVADNIDFVIAHWYPGGNSNSIVNEPRLTIPPMIHGTTAGQDTGSNAGLRDSIAAWRSDGDAQKLEIFITETDGYGGTPQTSDGLFAADAYATFFENGVTNVDWLELHNNQFMAEYTNEPNFAYFGIQSVHLLAEPGNELLSTTTSESDVRIHAARQDDGSVAVMVLNMNATSGGTRTVNISINGDTLSEEGVRYQTNGDTALSMSSLNDLGNSFSTSIAGRTLQLFLIAPLLGLPGDYNDDGAVDAADYVLWRDTLDQNVANGSGADGDANGIIDEADYGIWRANFGNTMASAAAQNLTSIPEPTSIIVWLAAWSVLLIRARRYCRRGYVH